MFLSFRMMTHVIFILYYIIYIISYFSALQVFLTNDKIDYTDLYAIYLRHWKKIDPRIMVELLVFTSCAGCLYREKYLKGQYENRKDISQTFARQKQETSERINTPEEIILRVNRSIQVEGIFGVLKEDYSLRRFLTKGKQKTETQFFLLAFAYTIRKLCNRLESGRFGVILVDVEVA